MNPASLATELRQRQYALGEVPRELIDALSDDELIDTYITCACCGEKQVTPWQLRKAIFLADDAESFLAHCAKLSRRHA